MSNALSTRTCDDCTKCCDGYLYAEIYEHIVDNETPCKFLDIENKKCSIYNSRPQDPCKDFLCEWRTNEHVYPWFKPSDIGIMIISEYEDDYYFLTIIEAGNSISVEILDWAITMVNTGKIENIQYWLYDRWNYISHNQDWIEFMREFNEDSA